MKARFVLVAVLASSLLPSLASARGADSYRHQIMVSSGVAHPSFNSLAGGQNPAGLVFNSGAHASLDAQSGSTGLESTDFGADLLFGGSGWGGGGGIDWRTDSGTGGSDGYVATYGLGAYLRGLQTAIGIGGSTGVSNAEGTSLDLGLLIGPYQKVTFGVTAYGFTGGIDNLGAGVDIMLGHGFSFVTDVLTDTGFDRFGIRPGFWVGSQKASLTVSVGFNTGGGNGSGGGGEDVGVGAQVMLGRNLNWQIYYQQINKIYTGLSFQL